MGIAKRTRYMENNPEDTWIVKGKIYYLNLRHHRNYMEYEFIDEKGHFHTIPKEDYSKYFEPVEDVDTRARERDWIERQREEI